MEPMPASSSCAGTTTASRTGGAGRRTGTAAGGKGSSQGQEEELDAPGKAGRRDDTAGHDGDGFGNSYNGVHVTTLRNPCAGAGISGTASPPGCRSEFR